MKMKLKIFYLLNVGIAVVTLYPASPSSFHLEVIVLVCVKKLTPLLP
jgi:hypothetical protein